MLLVAAWHISCSNNLNEGPTAMTIVICAQRGRTAALETIILNTPASLVEHIHIQKHIVFLVVVTS